MPLNPRSKRPPYVVRFVLYFPCSMKLSLFKFLFSTFLKLKAKWVSIDVITFLVCIDPVFKFEERDP